MPASTSTITTSRSPKEPQTARLRAEEETLQPPPIEVKEHDFFWTYTEEPHRTRRMAIIKAHPEVHISQSANWQLLHLPLLPTSSLLTSPSQVTKLCGPEPLTKYLVLFVVSIQVLCAYLLQDTPFFNWKFWATAYVVGATANQNLFLAIHEISHNLAFRTPWLNRALAIVANLPIGVPYSASFRVGYAFYSL